MRTVYIFTLVLGLLAACTADPDNEQASNPANFRLSAEANANSDEGTPAFNVYLLVGNEKIKVADALACDSLSVEQYEQYGVPDEAISALGCFWAGSGDYFYAIPIKGGIRVYRGFMGEEMSQGEIVYTPLMEFEDGQPHFDLGPKKDELVGTYALSQEEGSHILFVGLHEDTLIGEHFVLDGILPPVNQLNMLMTGLTPVDSVGLFLDEPKMYFTSSMGEGQFIRSRDGLEVWLYPDEGPGYLRLQKILSEDYSLPVQ
jgi:hypothetical protein